MLLNIAFSRNHFYPLSTRLGFAIYRSRLGHHQGICRLIRMHWERDHLPLSRTTRFLHRWPPAESSGILSKFSAVEDQYCYILQNRLRFTMFTNHARQIERTGRSGTPRFQYLQDLVTEFQKSTDEESKERMVANLANFAYDPYNYVFLRQLNVLELFLDCLTEPNEKLIEFGVGGICNCCADPTNATIITQCGGIPLIIGCLSSPVRNTVNYALGALYYLCNAATKRDILRPDVIEAIRNYAASGNVSVSFSNLANAFLDKHVHL